MRQPLPCVANATFCAPLNLLVWTWNRIVPTLILLHSPVCVTFNGAWSVYSYFHSKNIALCTTDRVFMVSVDLDEDDDDCKHSHDSRSLLGGCSQKLSLLQCLWNPNPRKRYLRCCVSIWMGVPRMLWQHRLITIASLCCSDPVL